MRLQMNLDMFDFHTHILPGMDDGSASVEESRSMLQELQRQGVDGLAATPHFYAERMSPEEFFARRQASWERLCPHLSADFPELRLGAEVRYFEGIHRYEGLERFCLEGTNLLLLEMPHGVWTKRMIAALTEMNARENISLMLAHVERYYRHQSRDVWDTLLRNGIRMQVSADFFLARRTRKAALKLLQEGRIHVLGTDCHNMTTRKPDMADAVSFIRAKGGADLLLRLQQREALLLQRHSMNEGGLT